MYDSFSYARQVLKVSKSIKNLIKILRLYERSLRDRDRPVLSSILSFLSKRAKEGDEDASWLYRELLARVGAVELSYDNSNLGIGSILFSNQEVGDRDGS
jgi:hypothetical protein